MTNPTSTIQANEKRLLKAFETCSIEVLDELIHESAFFVIPNGVLCTKKMVLDNYRSGQTAMSSITASEQVINILDDTAVVSVVLEMQGKYNDQVISRKFRYLRVWKLFNNNWKVIAVSGVQL
ncbi:MAG TPA: nuclear transport factor 2 family protein [Bacteroidia bacterium]|nr:nuclear transport factor 2 family protein [Bacteroidia bacterium]